MSGLSPDYITELQDIEFVSNYLMDTIPLPFNTKKFKWAKIIETKTKNTLLKNNTFNRKIKLNLTIDTKSVNLFSPYIDEFFIDNTPSEPIFIKIKSEKKLLGFVWICFNAVTGNIDYKRLKGLLLRKHGFAIGDRTLLYKYFKDNHELRKNYIGEVILTDQRILPNYSRNDIESSNLATRFYREIIDLVTTLKN